MLTFSLTSLIIFQSDLPEYPWSFVLGCTVIADAPASSTIPAISTALMLFLSQPLLILTVRGISIISTIDSTIDLTFIGSFSNALPALPLFVTLATGHPIFISIISTLVFSQMYLDANVSDSISDPTICCEIGRS